MPTPDLFFLSYRESNAEENWQKLKSRHPKAKRLHGIHGIYKAHALIAECAESEFFFVIDGDNEILADFQFALPHNPQKNSLYVWRAQNPVNDLVYGFGGIKLYNRSLFQNAKGVGPDVATTITPHYVPVKTLASITRFNNSALESWRGAFRECAKLTYQLRNKPNDKDTEKRREAWLTKGHDRPYGKWCLLGASQGSSFADQQWASQKDLSLINDFVWLEQQFSQNAPPS